MDRTDLCTFPGSWAKFVDKSVQTCEDTKDHADLKGIMNNLCLKDVSPDTAFVGAAVAEILDNSMDEVVLNTFFISNSLRIFYSHYVGICNNS